MKNQVHLLLHKMNSSSKPVIIIGAGVGGLSTATLLVNDGYFVSVYEKSNRVGGRTTSMEFKNHILDNGFHIMPFYKKSAIYEILKDVKIESRLKLAIVDKIAFYDNGFHTYPKGITDILKMSLIPFKSRISLLKILLPMAFTSMKKAEKLDSVPLTQVTSKLDFHSRQFLRHCLDQSSSTLVQSQVYLTNKIIINYINI